MGEFRTIDDLEDALRAAGDLPDRGLSAALFLALALEKPLLLEGEAGVGKTEAAKSLAAATSAKLIRLQCYEGLDVAHAVYEWNYPRQLLHIRAAQEGTVSEDELFGPEFLIRRPLLEAIDSNEPVVLLIDEIDRADEEFEAFLLEVLSDFQITIPELGTIRARRRPAVMHTSTARASCTMRSSARPFHWIGHPWIDREIEMVGSAFPASPTGSLPRRRRSSVSCAAWISRSPRGGGDDRLGDGAERARAAGDRRRRRRADARVGVKYREDIEAVRDETLARLVDNARAAATR